MEENKKEKKQIKISLGTAICICIIVVLTIALIGMGIYYNNQIKKVSNNKKSDNKTENIISENSITGNLILQGETYFGPNNLEIEFQEDNIFLINYYNEEKMGLYQMLENNEIECSIDDKNYFKMKIINTDELEIIETSKSIEKLKNEICINEKFLHSVTLKFLIKSRDYGNSEEVLIDGKTSYTINVSDKNEIELKINTKRYWGIEETYEDAIITISIERDEFGKLYYSGGDIQYVDKSKSANGGQYYQSINISEVEFEEITKDEEENEVFSIEEVSRNQDGTYTLFCVRYLLEEPWHARIAKTKRYIKVTVNPDTTYAYEGEDGKEITTSVQEVFGRDNLLDADFYTNSIIGISSDIGGNTLLYGFVFSNGKCTRIGQIILPT